MTSKGWYSRGYLPHFDSGGVTQSITYRLADSLPQALLRTWENELKGLSATEFDAEKCRRVENWLDAGHGDCVLRIPACAECVVETWQRFAGERYDLIAWVAMPNHVHVLIRVYEGWSLGKIVNSWRSYTARRINLMKAASLGRGAPAGGG